MGAGAIQAEVSVEDGSLVLRGVNEHALPEGLQGSTGDRRSEDAAAGFRPADVDHDGDAVVDVKVEMDDRRRGGRSRRSAMRIPQRAGANPGSTASAGVDWLEDANRRPTRQACLLNLLASLRTRPTLSAPLLDARARRVPGRQRSHVRKGRSYAARYARSAGDVIRRSPSLPKASRTRRSTAGC